ncbi:CobW family GTP-binding protein [Dactylosporangium sp. CA-233914]|uniref:CobW family GTP-binding protein n=1 Tax=Dactylosporangium sp. CA-233914 TaxID=3239934 RepID=UPI003D8D5B23
MTVPSDITTAGLGLHGKVRPSVTVLAGFAPAATLAVARTLLLADPALILVRHDLTGVLQGQVQRVVRDGTQLLEDVTVELVHGCISCTLREDVLPTLLRLSRERPGRDFVLALPEAVEPEALAAACAGHVAHESLTFDSYVAVVDAATFLADLDSSDDLRTRALHASEHDDRSVADVVVRQVEYADTVLLWDSPDHDGFESARLATLLRRLAPWATHLHTGRGSTVDCTDLARLLRRTGRHNPEVPGMLGRALEGFTVGVHEPVEDCGVVSVLFEARRPFHPQRLHDTLQRVTSPTLRSRGQCWIASQPDGAIGWESAGGGVTLGTLGYWLAALPAQRWNEATPLRRLASNLAWDPVFGDRRTVLAFIGVHMDAPAIVEDLTACLLTDDELADGFAAWTAQPDPFAGCFPLFEED